MKYIRILRALGTLCALLFAVEGHAATIFDAFKDGSLDLDFRYRFETVDDDIRRSNGLSLRTATASTLRTAVSYQSAPYRHISLAVLLENVAEIGPDDYNDGSNGKSQYATIVDPSETEFDEGYVKYDGFSNTTVKLGRQYITYRKAPLHRFMGTILWRQNWQTHDAITVENTSLPDTKISYGYIWNVNRIFGESARNALANFDSNSHVVNARYSGLPLGVIETYAYLLDFDNAQAFSTQTYGFRFSGSHPMSNDLSLNYAAEYAHQSDYDNNPNDISADYVLGGLGLTYHAQAIGKFGLKFDYELLSGDGGADRFVTILGTNHAYQGWADRFLVTPGDGIEDFIVTANASIGPVKFVASYHDLNSDRHSYDYGSEIDLLATTKVLDRLSLGAKYSNYDADRNATNLARNGANSGVSRDVRKFWIFAQIKF